MEKLQTKLAILPKYLTEEEIGKCMSLNINNIGLVSAPYCLKPPLFPVFPHFHTPIPSDCNAICWKKSELQTQGLLTCTQAVFGKTKSAAI